MNDFYRLRDALRDRARTLRSPTDEETALALRMARESLGSETDLLCLDATILGYLAYHLVDLETPDVWGGGNFGADTRESAVIALMRCHPGGTLSPEEERALRAAEASLRVSRNKTILRRLMIGLAAFGVLTTTTCDGRAPIFGPLPNSKDENPRLFAFRGWLRDLHAAAVSLAEFELSDTNGGTALARLSSKQNYALTWKLLREDLFRLHTRVPKKFRYG